MIITDITISDEAIALKRPFITALRRVDAVIFVRVRLHTDIGLIGTGEAPPTKAITGEDIESITLTIRDLITPRLLHRPLASMEEAQRLLHTCCEGSSSAKAAIDIALYDIFSQQAGQPLYAYLGGSLQTLVSDVTISLGLPEKMAEETYYAMEDGFDVLKIKVGGKDGLDIARIKAIREAAPNGILLIDANQAWSEAETLEIIEAIKGLDITLIEQPVIEDDLEGMQRITAKSPIPVLADEAVFTLEDAKKVIDTDAAHMINIKLMKCGGVYKAIEIIGLCKANDVSCMLGSMLEGPASIAAAAHLAMAFPETIVFLDLDSPMLYAKTPKDSPVESMTNTLRLLHDSGI